MTEERSISKRLAKNIFSNWAGFGINLLIAFFMSPFVVSKLGNTYYGIWVIMMQLTSYLGVLELGVRSSVMKYVAEHFAKDDREGLNRLVSAAISMYGIAAVLSLMITGALLFVFPLFFRIAETETPTVRLVLIITGLTVAQGLVFNVFYGVLTGIQRYDIFNKVFILFSFLRALLIVLFLSYGFGVIALGLIQLVINVGTNVTAYYYCKKEIPYLRVNWFGRSTGVYRKIIGYSVISFFITVSQKLIFQTSSFIIGGFLGVAAVTFYSIPLTLVEYMRRLVISMTEVFVPLASELNARSDEDRMKALLIQGTKLSILVGLPICVVFLTMGKQFIALWMGDEYAEAGNGVLVVLTIAQIASITHLTSREILFGLAKHRINAYCYGAEAIANVVLSVLLVKPLGLLGVAIGTAVPHFVIVTLVFPIIITRILHLHFVEYLWNSLLPGFLPGIPFAVACYWMERINPAHSLGMFFLHICFLLPAFLIPAWFLSFNRDERDRYQMLIMKVVLRIRQAVVTS